MKVEYYNLGSGSRGNCSILKYDGHAIMIDAGFSGVEIHRRLEASALSPEQIDAILVTHEHNDHINGVRVFSNKTQTPVFTNVLTGERLHHMKKRPEDLTLFNNGAPFQVGPFKIEAFSISHDAIDPVGFVVEVADRKMGLLTDVGHCGKMVPLKLQGCHMLVVESNHDPAMVRECQRPPMIKHRILGRRGHLSNDAAVELVDKCASDSLKHIMLAHLSSDCNHSKLARETMQAGLDRLGRSDIELIVAKQTATEAPILF